MHSLNQTALTGGENSPRLGSIFRRAAWFAAMFRLNAGCLEKLLIF
jgi:hypothetical protein